LSWFYVQQKSFEGLHSGKAIYKRNPESLSNIVNLANLSIEESDQDMAKEILDFVIEKHQGSTVAYSGADLLDQNENRQGARQRFCCY
jgi:predicted negative regulator of RcsB-dependent stress response